MKYYNKINENEIICVSISHIYFDEFEWDDETETYTFRG